MHAVPSRCLTRLSSSIPVTTLSYFITNKATTATKTRSSLIPTKNLIASHVLPRSVFAHLDRYLFFLRLNLSLWPRMGDQGPRRSAEVVMDGGGI
ncbi:hypothetical protein E2C01_033207 [Portunus trituberculatus]|uniref:Uncharacterized protein n=1 Tax=Portunus trituberculatus TaxID=210409 RepID=A0A5B7F3L5_PORTR|nr:hypothetical protein [Portunus trituberculatus]